jgi:hypothetical protein
MSPRSSEDAPVGLYRKAQPDLYTVMLVVALLALIVGTVVMYLESSAYGPTPQGAATVETGFLWEGGAGGVADIVALSSFACGCGDARCVSG